MSDICFPLCSLDALNIIKMCNITHDFVKNGDEELIKDSLMMLLFMFRKRFTSDTIKREYAEQLYRCVDRAVLYNIYIFYSAYD